MTKHGLPVIDRLMLQVKKTETCWIWSGYLDRCGYGTLSVDRRTRYVHRLAFELESGPVPEGMHLDHVCHNRACVNTAHLRVVTVKQNAENRRGPNSGSASGLRGVSRNGNGWRGVVDSKGTRLNAGTFPTKDEAAEAVRKLRNSIFTHNDADRGEEATACADANESWHKLCRNCADTAPSHPDAVRRIQQKELIHA